MENAAQIVRYIVKLNADPNDILESGICVDAS